MVSIVLFVRLGACVSLCVSVVVAAQPCSSTFCFRLGSRKMDLDIHIFNYSKPLPIEELIKDYGYPVESHRVVTEDGYILKYHRIPHGKTGSEGPREPVLLQHGLLGASSLWALETYALAYTLADAGFDVWLGNTRGNTYCRDHVKYNPDTDKKVFWDFSWHEMGYYDLPAGVDYILNATDATQLHYLGHSMGTTMFLVLGAMRPQYMDKVKTAVLMAPVAFPWNIRSPVANFLKSLHTVLNWLASAFGIYEVFPYSNTNNWLNNNICARPRTEYICRDIMGFIGGFDDAELNRTELQRVLQYMPAGASFKQLKHFRQITEKGSDFKMFDYGYISNMWRYHSLSPPPYNLTQVTAPVYIYYAMNDWLAVPKDVFHVVSHLPNVQRVTKVSDDRFNHLDFMWAKDAQTILYNDIVNTLKNTTLDQPVYIEYDYDNKL